MNSSVYKLSRFAPLLLLLAYLLVTGFGLDRYPLVWVDEGWIGEVAAQAARGLPLGSPSHGTLYRYADRLFWMPPLYFYELGGAFRVAGVDLLVGRWFNVFVGGLTTLALFFFLRRRVGVGPAFVAALFTACDTFVWKTHRTIRFESLLTLFGVLLLIAMMTALEREEDDRPARGAWFATGLLAGLALNVHPNALIWLFAALALALVRRGARLMRTGGAWLAFTLAALMSLPYLLYLGTDAATGFANVIGQNSYHLEHGASEGWAPLREWRRWADFFVLPARLPALAAWAVLVGVALARLGRGGGGPRRIAGSGDEPGADGPADSLVPEPASHDWRAWTPPLLAALGTYVTLLALLPNKTLLYLAGAVPIVALIGALAWSSRPARAALVVGLLASLAVDAGLLWRSRDCRVVRDLAAIRGTLTPEDRVAGTFVTWWATQPVSAAEPPRPFHEFSRGATLEAVASFGASAIILGDRQWEQEAPTRFGPLDRALAAPDGPLGVREPVLALPGSCLGPVRVYRLR